jgi:hypothetical protein
VAIRGVLEPDRSTPDSLQVSSTTSSTGFLSDLPAAYFSTTWSVRASGRSLRVSPGRPTPAELRHFAIVTAYNPASRETPPGVNRAAHRALRNLLDGAGRRWLPSRAHGTGPQPRRWDEPGFVLLGPESADAALAIGVALAQNAVLIGQPGQPARLMVTRDGFCGRSAGEMLDP